MIKNIIFDLGVVLLDVKYQDTIEAFSTLGMTKPEEAFSKYKQDDFFRNYEKGLICDDDFLIGLSKRVGGSDQLGLKNAWCRMLGDLPKDKFELIKELSRDFRLFILSNTNSIHQIWFEKKIDNQYGWKDFSNCFEFIGYSHLINERKPTKEAFQFIVNKFELSPAETLFIDDTMEHVKGARKLGIQAKHYAEGQDLKELILSSL